MKIIAEKLAQLKYSLYLCTIKIRQASFTNKSGGNTINSAQHMDKVLYEIYQISADYICGKADEQQLECISRICELYMQICNDEGIPEEIGGLLQCAVNHINHDVEDGKTLEEHIADGFSLIESLSGELGQYFE